LKLIVGDLATSQVFKKLKLLGFHLTYLEFGLICDVEQFFLYQLPYKPSVLMKGGEL